MHIHRHHLLLLFLLAAVAIIRYVPGAGEFYALNLYPFISATLSRISSSVSVSLDEIVALVGILWLIMTLVRGVKNAWKWWKIAGRTGEVVCWYVVWFYLGWGCNYFRDDFYTRMQVEPAEADNMAFMDFAIDFADSLNTNWERVYSLDGRCAYELDKEVVIAEIKEIYQKAPVRSGLCTPKEYQHPKNMLINWLYSASGVLGFVGPWVGESLLNEQLKPVQYPFTYAHELSHLLGISGEAEANYWAYAVCRQSESPFVRYSAYEGLLYHVMVNASMILSKDEYRQWVNSIHPQIIEQQKELAQFWQEQRIHWLDELQNMLLDFQLKGNRIPSGKANYSQVVQMVISCPPSSCRSKHSL